MSTATATTLRVYGMPLNAKSYESNDDGTLTIIGVASTTNKDYANEIVSPEVLNSLAEQAPGLNLFRDHNRRYEGGIGAIVEAWVKDNQLWIKAKVLAEYAQGIKERLDIGMNFGFSISGFPRKQRTPDGILITDYDLKEITLTYIPMNWDTYGTVEYKDQNLIASNCLTGACAYMLKNNGEIMEKKDDTNFEEKVPEKPVEEKDNAGFTDEQLTQIKDMMNEFGVELESRILEAVESKNSQVAEDAATKAAEETANKILAEMKATEEVQETVEEKEIPEPKEPETEEEIVDEKSEAGMKEPTGEEDETPETPGEPSKDDDVEEEEEEKEEVIDEKSLDAKIHDEIVKQLNEKSVQSKFDKFKSETKKGKTVSTSKPKRDAYGRNLNYI